MNFRLNPMASLLAVSLVTSASFAYAQNKAPESQYKEVAPGSTSSNATQTPHKPGMHMHRSDAVHAAMKSDADGAKAYKGESQVLRDNAASHRKIAANYRGRGSGKVNYRQIALHCDNLAKLYEDAAKEADAVATELSK